MSKALHTTHIKSLPLLHKGKVRDIYDIDDRHMLIVTTDRISAFDVVMPTAIPGKGEVLNQVTRFWMEKLAHIIPNHLSDMSLEEALPDAGERAEVENHATIVRKLKALPVEAIVRGYLIGSGWKDYKATGKVCGIDLPDGLQQAQQLPEPIFTPATKAEIGDHDENISFAEVENLIELMALKAECRQAMVAKLELASGELKLTFDQDSVDPHKLVHLVNAQSDRMMLDPRGFLLVRLNPEDRKQPLPATRALLSHLIPKTSAN